MKYWNSILGIIIAIKNNNIVIIDYINETEKKMDIDEIYYINATYYKFLKK